MNFRITPTISQVANIRSVLAGNNGKAVSVIYAKGCTGYSHFSRFRSNIGKCVEDVSEFICRQILRPIFSSIDSPVDKVCNLPRVTNPVSSGRRRRKAEGELTARYPSPPPILPGVIFELVNGDVEKRNRATSNPVSRTKRGMQWRRSCLSEYIQPSVIH